jgi:hypothetical protein
VRRLVIPLTMGIAAVAATAIAQDGGGPPTTTPPVVRSTSVLHWESDRSCHGTAGVTLRVTPPDGVEIGALSVRLDGRQVVRLTGVDSSASVTVRLPRRSARVTTAGETLDGQQIARSRRYRSCVPRLAPQQPRRDEPPVVVGGGEA